MTGVVELVVREATDDDVPQVLRLLRASLGKQDDPRYEGFFRWKHRDNPFGRSPSWLAEVGGEPAGFRTFMRWEFVDGGLGARAARAVDTATAPGFRGRGIFQRLTLHGLRALGAEGVAFVFNTPNEQSRPGYLKMGWSEVGRVPVSVRPRGPAAALRMARSRVPAVLWSPTVAYGEPVTALGPDGAAALDEATAAPGWRTRRTPAYLRWRYGFAPLGYRLAATDGGLLVFRVRDRGACRELVVCELAGDPRGRRRVLTRALRGCAADYAIGVGRPAGSCLPLPGQGPILTFRPLQGQPAPASWSLTMGDVELF